MYIEFTSEDEYNRLTEMVYEELALAESAGQIRGEMTYSFSDPSVRTPRQNLYAVAFSIVSRLGRSAGQAPVSGDIADVPGVHVERVAS